MKAHSILVFDSKRVLATFAQKKDAEQICTLLKQRIHLDCVVVEDIVESDAQHVWKKSKPTKALLDLMDLLAEYWLPGIQTSEAPDISAGYETTE